MRDSDSSPGCIDVPSASIRVSVSGNGNCVFTSTISSQNYQDERRLRKTVTCLFYAFSTRQLRWMKAEIFPDLQLHPIYFI